MLDRRDERYLSGLGVDELLGVAGVEAVTHEFLSRVGFSGELQAQDTAYNVLRNGYLGSLVRVDSRNIHCFDERLLTDSGGDHVISPTTAGGWGYTIAALQVLHGGELHEEDKLHPEILSFSNAAELNVCLHTGDYHAEHGREHDEWLNVLGCAFGKNMPVILERAINQLQSIYPGWQDLAENLGYSTTFKYDQLQYFKSAYAHPDRIAVSHAHGDHNLPAANVLINAGHPGHTVPRPVLHDHGIPTFIISIADIASDKVYLAYRQAFGEKAQLSHEQFVQFMMALNWSTLQALDLWNEVGSRPGEDVRNNSNVYLI